MIELQSPIFQSQRVTLFVDILLPLPLLQSFTYRVPFELNEAVQVGARAVVQFGPKKMYTGVVVAIHQKPPAGYDAKYILEVMDTVPCVNNLQLQFFERLANYYMCMEGEVLNAALPSGLKISSQSRVQYNPAYIAYGDELLSLKEQVLIDALKTTDSMLYDDVVLLLKQKTILPLLKSLIAKGAVILYEQVKEKYSPKIKRLVKLKPEYCKESAIHDLLDKLEKRPQQSNVLLAYLREVPVMGNLELNERGLERSKLAKDSPSAFQTLVKNGVFEEFEVLVSRLDEFDTVLDYNLVLSEEQIAARDQIIHLFETKDTILLHGITGSGKTEIYIDLIAKYIENGSQVLYLLPEIALTTQIVSRLKVAFGDKLGIYHSKFSDNERVEVWRSLIEGKFQVVVGVRSAIFLPFNNLGLIVIDEEHETSYKQHDPSPRYHARESALMLAQLHHAKTLLGSATPSVETYYLALQGKFGLVTLSKRYGIAQLPDIQFAQKVAPENSNVFNVIFTPELIQQITLRIERKEQTILFLNRRGYSPYLSCENCGWIPYCNSCNVSYTYHQYKGSMNCHYCGNHEKAAKICPTCGSTKIQTVGFGTEKIEDELQLILPKARVLRMDLETTRTKNGYADIINEFAQGKIDILVGTQMVTKGLDFDKVSLVGVIDIDKMINYPDFRSFERTFHLVTQVSGRAGRRDVQGQVIIQTINKNHPLLKRIQQQDFVAFYNREIKERERFAYPPFTRLIKITVKNKDKIINDVAARQLSNQLIANLGKERILGPEAPLIDKIRDYYIQEIIIKLERDKVNIAKAKDLINKCIKELLLLKSFKSVYINIDVDFI